MPKPIAPLLQENDTLFSLLQDAPFFQDIQPETLQHFTPFLTIASYPAGTILLKEGQSNEEIFFLLQGTVRVEVGGECIVRLRRKWDLFGEMSVISDKPATASIITENEVDVVRIQRHAFESHWKEHGLEFKAILHSFFSHILADKLALTTLKAKEYERTNKELQQAKEKLESLNQQLQHSHHNLEDKVMQRTAAYRKALEDAKKANQSKSLFLANMSHEFRTPLHGILSFAEKGLLRAESADPEKIKTYFGHIQKSANRLLPLVNNLLDLEKLEAGQMKFHFAPTNLWEILSSIAQELTPLCENKNLQLKLHPPDFIPTLKADAAKLGQVFTNLLSNALKFSPEGSLVEVYLSRGHIAVDENPVAAYKISILDQGPGIPPEEIEEIFEKFHQSSRTQQGSGGTGLGLSITREILHHHGGIVFAKNRPQGGAELIVKLPLSEHV